MDILFAVIGVLVGGSLGYWWRGRTIDRPLPVLPFGCSQSKEQKVFGE